MALPDQESFFNAVRENLARATREQHRYAYKERRTELHTEDVRPTKSQVRAHGRRLRQHDPVWNVPTRTNLRRWRDPGPVRSAFVHADRHVSCREELR